MSRARVGVWFGFVSSALLPLQLAMGGVEVEAGQHVSMACVISLPPHELLRPKQPVLAVQELRRQVLCSCVPFALLLDLAVGTSIPIPIPETHNTK